MPESEGMPADDPVVFAVALSVDAAAVVADLAGGRWLGGAWLGACGGRRALVSTIGVIAIIPVFFGLALPAQVAAVIGVDYRRAANTKKR